MPGLSRPITAKIVAVVVAVRVELEGNIHIWRLIDFDFEIRPHHSDDFVKLAAQCDPFSDDLGSAAEAPTSEPVGQHCGLRRAGQVFLRRISTAEAHISAAEAKGQVCSNH
jgi:hypothetical protein